MWAQRQWVPHGGDSKVEGERQRIYFPRHHLPAPVTRPLDLIPEPPPRPAASPPSSSLPRPPLSLEPSTFSTQGGCGPAAATAAAPGAAARPAHGGGWRGRLVPARSVGRPCCLLSTRRSRAPLSHLRSHRRTDRRLRPCTGSILLDLVATAPDLLPRWRQPVVTSPRRACGRQRDLDVNPARQQEPSSSPS
jgi:hypothetical protein